MHCNLNALQLTLNHMFDKLDDFVVHQVVTFYKQVSVNDCGLCLGSLFKF